MIYYLFLLAAFFELGVSQKSSPCPSVFSYESPNSAEPDRWYGILILKNQEQLKGIWIEVTLDEPAQLLGNWFGETSTTNNQEFTIRNMTYILEAHMPMAMRLFVKYGRTKSVPSVLAVRLNGKLICEETPHNEASTTRRPQSGISLSEQSGANRETDSTSTNTNNGGRGTSSSSNSGNRGTGTGASGTNSRPATTQSSRPSSGGRVTSKSRPSSNALTDSSGSSDSNYNSNSNRNPENYGTSSSDNGNSYDNNGRDPDYGSNSNNNYNNNRLSGSSSSESNNNRNPSFSGSNSDGGLSFAEENNSDDYFPGDFSVVARLPAINRPSSPRGNSVTNTIGVRKPRCGTVAVRPRPLITFAEGTAPGEWPWHVALYHSQGSQLRYICGGTLVSEKHIITAAHCVTKPSTTTSVGVENVLVYLGKYNLKKFGSEVQDREVSRIYIHPNYNSTYYFNDLAVLKLSEPVTMNNYVRASCLWEDESDLNSIVDQLGTVVGWGFDENKQISNELMKAEMPVVDTGTCFYSNRDFFSQFINEQTYCAGFRNGTSACNGDSGGGMVFPKTHRDGSTTWQLRGVVSVGVALQGEHACDPSHYIVFTDTAQHLEWIQEIMSQR